MILVQLTDSHLKAGGRPAYGRVDTAAALRRAVATVNAFGADAVIFSGDLTDRGDAAEFEALADILADLRAPVFAVPGNHDRRDTLRAAFLASGFHDARTPFCAGVAEGFPLRLIGLDSSVPGAPHGEIGAAQLAWLEARLAERPDAPTLAFVHHPPMRTGIRHMDVQNLHDGDALLALLARHPQVLHLACGHVHRAIAATLGGVAVSIAPAPAHAVDLDLDPAAPPAFRLEPPMLRLFRFADGVLLSHLACVDPAPGPFPFFDGEGRLID